MRLAHVETALTPTSCETQLADTLVVIGQLDTIQTGTGVTGLGEALVYVTLASVAGEAWRTVAAVPANPVHTCAVVQTLGGRSTEPHGRSTVVLVDLTQNTQGAWGAGADVMADQVDAGASVLTGVRLALIDLHLAILPHVAWHTITLVSSHISPAGGAIATGFVLTVVHLALTVASCVVCGTLAVVGVSSVHTVPSVMTQLVSLKASLASGNLTGHPRYVTITA